MITLIHVFKSPDWVIDSIKIRNKNAIVKATKVHNIEPDEVTFINRSAKYNYINSLCIKYKNDTILNYRDRLATLVSR